MITENILMNSMGFNDYKKVVENSVERFDNYSESVYADYAQAQENLTFIDTFEKVNRSNTDTKLRMLAKINKAYGSCNRGIENYCRVQSLEAEAAEQQTDSKTGDKPAEQPKEGAEKKLKWYQKVWEAIKKFFAKIRDFFKMIWGKIIGLFRKNEEVHEAIDQAQQEEPEKIKTMAQYLAEVKLSDDKDYKAVVITEQTFASLAKSADVFARLGTQYDNSIKKLMNNDMTAADEFVKVVSTNFHINNVDVGRATSQKEMEVMESRIKTVTEKLTFNNDTQVKWINVVAGSKLSTSAKFEDIVGTKDPLKVNKMFKNYKGRLENINKSFQKTFNVISKATDSYDKYIKNQLNSNSDVDQINAYRIASACTLTFRAMTTVSNSYMKVVQMIMSTVASLENNLVAAAKKVGLSFLKKVGQGIKDTPGNIKDAYNTHKENQRKKNFNKSNMANADREVDWNA